MALRDKAPEGLIPWIREQKDIDWPNYLIYKAGYYRDPMTGQNEPCADAVCTACGARQRLDRAYSAKCMRGNASFGVSWEAWGRETHGSGEVAECPECGNKVTVLHTTAANNLTRYVWPMSFERAGMDLICYLWRVERWINKDGAVHYAAASWEAYIFGKKTAAVYKRWSKGMFSRYYVNDVWTPIHKFEDRAYDINIVYCPEGIEAATRGTYMENSKLELYMAVKGEYRFPVVWLRLYQKRHKAETLMTCGAAKLVAGIIAEEKNAHSYYQDWTRRVDCLKDLNWKKNRPTDILRISKNELAYFADKAPKDGAKRLMVIERARKAGYALRPGEEDGGMALADQLRLAEQGITPSKVRRYLSKQKRRYGRDWGVSYLWDYWSMARQFDMDLDDEDIRWPQNLTGAHDRLSERQKEIETKLPPEQFEKRYQRMSRYAWEHDGILIRPARSDAELKAEGKALHHCVGSYAGRHAAGKLTIFFIRRAEEPDKPWFTLDFDEKSLSVNQNRGLCNCDRTQEIKDFEAAWLAWVRAGCKREKEKEDKAA